MFPAVIYDVDEHPAPVGWLFILATGQQPLKTFGMLRNREFSVRHNNPNRAATKQLTTKFAKGPTRDEAMGMNDLGQVAYVFRLADGRSGIAVWQIPEPTTTILLALVCVVWVSKVR